MKPHFISAVTFPGDPNDVGFVLADPSDVHGRLHILWPSGDNEELQFDDEVILGPGITDWSDAYYDARGRERHEKRFVLLAYRPDKVAALLAAARAAYPNFPDYPILGATT